MNIPETIQRVGNALRVRLPGYAHRKLDGEPQWIYGHVHFSDWGNTGPVSQTIETNSRLYPVIKLIGATFAYWCSGCTATVWEEEIILKGGIRHGDVRKQICPRCGGSIAPLQRGDKVRCHYRFSAEGKWGAMWAERWEW